MRYKITQWLGYAFCEFSFQWFNLIDVPLDEDTWKWYHHVNFFIGGKPYEVGCYFYRLGGSSENR